METIRNYIEENKQRFLDELFELLRIPSVSSVQKHKGDMVKAAGQWKQILLKAGADQAEVMKTDGNPVVYGEKMINPSAPTVLVYAHYDVMPADPLELWETPPFAPEIRNGKIWARGADDDKGQGFIHAKAFELLMNIKTLPCNVKFMIEGEEEIGSVSLEKFCKENKALLKSDVIIVSDTGMIASDIPSITVGLRGLSYMEVEVTGPNKDLHSGIYGGAVANPANVLAKMIASLTDENNKITIPGFYRDVLETSEEERKEMGKAPFDEAAYKKNMEVGDLVGEAGYTTLERTGIRPTLDVNGIWGGHIDEGSKTIIPSKASAKISMRLVPNQDHNKISRLFEQHFYAIAPKGVTVKVKNLHGGQGYVCPIGLKAYKAAEKAYKEAFGKKPIPTRSGGSIPIISAFEEILGVKSILMGFGLGSDSIHSPNENFPLHNFYKGIETVAAFYKYFAEMMR